jgi:hypothetical protein
LFFLTYIHSTLNQKITKYGCNGFELIFKMKDIASYGMVQALLNGNRFFVLFAIGENSWDIDKEKFFDSFEFTNLVNVEWKSSTNLKKDFTTWTPAPIETFINS